jgi:hypothetical protein
MFSCCTCFESTLANGSALGLMLVKKRATSALSHWSINTFALGVGTPVPPGLFEPVGADEPPMPPFPLAAAPAPACCWAQP